MKQRKGKKEMDKELEYNKRQWEEEARESGFNTPEELRAYLALVKRIAGEERRIK